MCIHWINWLNVFMVQSSIQNRNSMCRLTLKYKNCIHYAESHMTHPWWESTNHSVCLVFRDIRYSVATQHTFQCSSKDNNSLKKTLVKRANSYCQLSAYELTSEFYLDFAVKWSLAPHSGSFRASQQSCSVTARDASYVSIFTSLLRHSSLKKKIL